MVTEVKWAKVCENELQALGWVENADDGAIWAPEVQKEDGRPLCIETYV